MNRKKFLLFLIPVVVMLVNLACGFSASTANIKDAKMARDNDGTQPTTRFSAKDTFYCNVELANAPDDTKVKAVWTAEQVDGAQPNTQIGQYETTTGSGTLHFKLTNDTAWPNGKYKVDLYLNDKLARTMEFQVQ
jgi:hypothetical protein